MTAERREFARRVAAGGTIRPLGPRRRTLPEWVAWLATRGPRRWS